MYEWNGWNQTSKAVELAQKRQRAIEEHARKQLADTRVAVSASSLSTGGGGGVGGAGHGAASERGHRLYDLAREDRERKEKEKEKKQEAERQVGPHGRRQRGSCVHGRRQRGSCLHGRRQRGSCLHAGSWLHAVSMHAASYNATHHTQNMKPRINKRSKEIAKAMGGSSRERLERQPEPRNSSSNNGGSSSSRLSHGNSASDGGKGGKKNMGKSKKGGGSSFNPQINATSLRLAQQRQSMAAAGGAAGGPRVSGSVSGRVSA